MSNFCSHCGTPSNGAAFCANCGADLRSVSSSPICPPQNPPTSSASPISNAAPLSTVSAPAKGMSTGAKIAIAALVVFVAMSAAAIGGVVYLTYRVKQKVAQVKSEYLGSDSGSSNGRGDNARTDTDSSSTLGNPCRYLSAQEVGKAIGVKIEQAKADGAACSYVVAGTTADLTAKHMSAIAASKGADAQSQNIVQNFAGAIFHASQDQKGQGSDDNGLAPVLVISVDDQSANAQMRLNHGFFGNIGGASQSLPGIGDEAFDVGNAMIMVRKGNKLIRMMYSTCPCALDAITPLARKLADAV